MIENNQCKHFNGVQHEVCERGVKYEHVWDGQHLPCIHPGSMRCGLLEYPTDEEFRAQLAEATAAATESMKRLAGLMSGESRECLECHEPITALEQVGRCVYARPCGCRQYQGTVPDAWKVEAE